MVAMSGGVDSSVAAALMCRAGHEVIGVTMTLASTSAPGARGCCSVWDVKDAEKVAWKLGIPHYVFNLREEFGRQVVGDFLEEYARGRTPNPCRRCNVYIKFDQFRARAGELGAERIVTGHHARIRREPETGRARLLRGRDPRKDQSYVLAGLSQEQLAGSLFPVGELQKERVRALARELGLGVADKAESQDLCFIPDGDTAGFLARSLPEAAPGPILDLRGVEVGQHRGLPFYTVGQRRGLGLSGGEARFVLRLDVQQNAVVVGPDEALREREMLVEEVRWLAPAPPERARIQVRSTSRGGLGRIEAFPGGRARVRFDQAQRALAPGQAAVFYRRDEVLGGGIIERAGSSEAAPGWPGLGPEVDALSPGPG